MNTRAVTEGALMAAITVIFALLSNYLPFFSGFSYFVLPFPTIILFVRHGKVAAAIESLAASFLLVFFIGPVNALLIGSQIVFPGLALGYGFRENKSGGTRVLYGYFAYLIVLAVEVVLFQYLTGISMSEDFINSVNESVKMISGIYQESGILDSENSATLMNGISELSETVKMMFPAMILMMPALFSYCVCLITDVLFRRFKIPYRPVPGITQWQVPQSAKTFLALVTIVSILLSWVVKNPAFEIYPFTILTIVIFFYVIMGFAFIFWFISRKDGRRHIFLRILIVTIAMIFSQIILLIFVIGMLDVNFDIRRFFTKTES